MGRLCDYFAVCGGGDDLKVFEGVTDDSQDVMDLNVSFGNIQQRFAEEEEGGFKIIRESPSGFHANIGHKTYGLLESKRDVHICLRRRRPGDTRPPIVDVVVVSLHRGDKVPKNYQVVRHTLRGEDATLRRGTSATGKKQVYLAIRRQDQGFRERYHQSYQQCALVDVMVINQGKGETNPSQTICDKKKHRLIRSKTGASLYLALKKGPPKGLCDLPYQAEVVERFPFTDYADFPFPADVFPSFCFPKGLRLEWAALQSTPQPSSFPFVLTTGNGTRVYAAALTLYEPLDEATLTRLRSNPSIPANAIKDAYAQEGEEVNWVVFCPRTLLVVSHCPFIYTLKRWLGMLYALSLSPSTIPVERIIAHLCLRMPVPHAGGPALALFAQPGMEPIVFKMPPENGLPLLDVPLTSLVTCLSAENILSCFALLLLEEKVVMYSRSAALVVEVMESLRALLFPFDWQSCYISRLNLSLLEALEFPGAYLIGVHDDTNPSDPDPYADPNCLINQMFASLPDDVTVISLDDNHINAPMSVEHAVTNYHILPPEPANILLRRLRFLITKADITVRSEAALKAADAAYTFAPTPDLVDDEREPLDDKAVRGAFLCFQCEIMEGYTDHLITPDADWMISSNQWFDFNGFMAARPPELAPFFERLTQSQLFSSFVQGRTSSGSYTYVYFDRCLEVLRNEKSAFTAADRTILLDEVVCNLNNNVRGTHQRTLSKRDSYNWEDDSSEMQAHFSQQSTQEILACEEPAGTENSPINKLLSTPKSFPKRLNPDLIMLPEENGQQRSRVSSTISPEISFSAALIRSDIERQPQPHFSQAGPSVLLVSDNMHTPTIMATHAFAAWFLCLPAALLHTPLDAREALLICAFGCLEKMQSVYALVPDEALYRALFVACGLAAQSGNFSKEVVCLWKELQSHGIQPNAATLGQYTKAVVDAQSRDNCAASSSPGGRRHEIRSSCHRAFNLTTDSFVGLGDLDIRGRHWRAKAEEVANQGAEADKNSESETVPVMRNGGAGEEVPMDSQYAALNSHPQAKVLQLSSSILNLSMNGVCIDPPSLMKSSSPKKETYHHKSSIKVTAIWSGSKHSEDCAYRPLDEEIMACWSLKGRSRSVCARCRKEYIPKLHYTELDPGIQKSMDRSSIKMHNWAEFKSTNLSPSAKKKTAGHPISKNVEKTGLLSESFTQNNDVWSIDQMSPQAIGISDLCEGLQEVESEEDYYEVSTKECNYISPVNLRLQLEEFIQVHGPEGLTREDLWREDPTLFLNLWWYCARFELPLPLSPHKSYGSRNTTTLDGNNSNQAGASHFCMYPLSDLTLWIGVVSRNKNISIGAGISLLSSLALDTSAGKPLSDLFDKLEESEDASHTVSALRTSLSQLSSALECYDASINMTTAEKAVLNALRTIKSLGHLDEFKVLMQWLVEAQMQPLAQPLSLYQLLMTAQTRCSSLNSLTTLNKEDKFLDMDGGLWYSSFDKQFITSLAKLGEGEKETLKPDGFPSDLALKFRNVFGHLY